MIEKDDEIWVKIPKSVVHEKLPGTINGRIFAYDSVDGIELKLQCDKQAAENEDYKLIMKANRNVLKRLAKT